MKATKAQVEARVTELLRIRLDGAEFWDVREYAREKEQEEGSPWQLAEGQKPLSDGQLWRYLARVDRLIAESCRASRKKLLRRHLAQRRALYAKAVSQGDIRGALACVRDEAELQGIYPPAKVKAQHTGAKGGPIQHEVSGDHDHHVDADPDQLAAILRALAEAGALDPGTAGPAGDPAPDEVRPPQAPPEAGGLPPPAGS